MKEKQFQTNFPPKRNGENTKTRFKIKTLSFVIYLTRALRKKSQDKNSFLICYQQKKKRYNI